MRLSSCCIHALAVTGLFVVGIGIATADDIDCPPNPDSDEVEGNVLVTGVCRLDGTEVEGNVVLFSGGSVILRNARIDGNIQSSTDSPFEVDIDASGIGGNIQLDDLVGDNATVRNSRIDGNIQVDRNRARLQISGNNVGGNIQAIANTGGIDIVGNRIDGNLECRGNNPAPTGENNTVEGNREGQCNSLGPAAEPIPDEPEAPVEPGETMEPDSNDAGTEPIANEPGPDSPGSNVSEENNLKGSSDLILLSLLGLLLVIAARRRLDAA